MMQKRTVFQLSVLVFLLVAALVVGNVTYARYRDAVSKEFSFTAKTATENGAIVVTSADGWQTTENGKALTFTLSLEGTPVEKRSAVLQLTATGRLSPKTQVTLTAGDAVYTATATPIVAGSALYAQMGDGYVFRFTDENGELTWPTDGTTALRLTVLGASDAALLRLIVT